MTTVQTHGGLREAELRELGLRPDEVIDFSASVNPLGTSPKAVVALREVDYARYPDPDCMRLREAIAAHCGVTPDEVLPGNGATELIHLVVRLFVRHGQRPIVFMPTFGEFERACQAMNAHPYPWHANPAREFRWNFANKAAVLRRVTPPLVYLCSPNNPTGAYPAEHDVRGLAMGLIAGPLLLDESYISFVEQPWDALPLMRTGRVLVLRSMTKDYGLAGLRLGYLLAQPDVVNALRRLQPEWSVSAAAQAAGVAALSDHEHLDRGRAAVRAGKAVLRAELTRLGVPFHEGAANFILIRVGNATAVRTALLRQGLAVRDCTSFGLSEYIRVGVRRPEECERLAQALARVLEERKA
ncbi:MAG: aminotransferase class I/II [Chloroflexota bacterium]